MKSGKTSTTETHFHINRTRKYNYSDRSMKQKWTFLLEWWWQDDIMISCLFWINFHLRTRCRTQSWAPSIHIWIILNDDSLLNIMLRSVYRRWYLNTNTTMQRFKQKKTKLLNVFEFIEMCKILQSKKRNKIRCIQKSFSNDLMKLLQIMLLQCEDVNVCVT